MTVQTQHNGKGPMVGYPIYQPQQPEQQWAVSLCLFPVSRLYDQPKTGHTLAYTGICEHDAGYVCKVMRHRFPEGAKFVWLILPPGFVILFSIGFAEIGHHEFKPQIYCI